MMEWEDYSLTVGINHRTRALCEIDDERGNGIGLGVSILSLLCFQSMVRFKHLKLPLTKKCILPISLNISKKYN